MSATRKSFALTTRRSASSIRLLPSRLKLTLTARQSPEHSHHYGNGCSIQYRPRAHSKRNVKASRVPLTSRFLSAATGKPRFAQLPSVLNVSCFRRAIGSRRSLSWFASWPLTRRRSLAYSMKKRCPARSNIEYVSRLYPLAALRQRFDKEDARLLDAAGFRRGPRETNVGQWDADELENAIAFVGAELRVENWLKRARQLTAQLNYPATREHLATDIEEEADSDEGKTAPVDEARAVQKRRAEWFEPVDIPLPGSERRAKPARELHPALIAWSALVIERLGQLI